MEKKGTLKCFCTSWWSKSRSVAIHKIRTRGNHKMLGNDCILKRNAFWCWPNDIMVFCIGLVMYIYHERPLSWFPPPYMHTTTTCKDNFRPFTRLDCLRSAPTHQYHNIDPWKTFVLASAALCTTNPRLMTLRLPHICTDPPVCRSWNTY